MTWHTEPWMGDTWRVRVGVVGSMICKMTFHTAAKLERHLKYSQMHSRNVEALQEVASGARTSEQTYYERKIKWEVGGWWGQGRGH